ncbi:MAG: RluA family pseudouridine synthase [Anaerolineae bacterium]|nr:RluA family pseudouridine synthase [Anaerolineae bacterium]
MMCADLSASEIASEAPWASEVSFEDEEENEICLTLAVAEDGERLDKWLAGRLPEYSRAQIQRWIADGRVTAGPRPLKASYKVNAGEVISVVVPAPEDYAVEPEPIPLAVLYEDDDLLVINKPAGMVVHPAAGNYHGTLVNAVLHHCPHLAGVGGVQRPGIVHRLDKDTSGVILVAKNDAAQRALQAQFKAREVHKTYLALVHGWMAPRQGEIRAPIGRDPHHRQRMAVVPLARGRDAVTRYAVQSYLEQPAGPRSTGVASPRYTLVACHPLTGRTHQIRVHLAHVGHPIVGDPVYGGRRKTALHCPRQFLHAERIRFRLPATGQEVEFSAPLPADLSEVLGGLNVVQPSP